MSYRGSGERVKSVWVKSIEKYMGEKSVGEKSGWGKIGMGCWLSFPPSQVYHGSSNPPPVVQKTHE